MRFPKVALQATGWTQILQLTEESLSHTIQLRPGDSNDMVGVNKAPLLPKWGWPRTKHQLEGWGHASLTHGPMLFHRLSKGK